MYAQSNISEPNLFINIPLIDGDFDSFEVNSDFEMQLREAETANFYHDSFNPEE